MSASEDRNIHPIHDSLLKREAKELSLSQRGLVVWFYGLSASGKSTIAAALERKLHDDGFNTHLLDGDNVRAGLNRDLGFSDDDRNENIRRIAEVAKLFVESGLVTLASFITPFETLRDLAKEIVGESNWVSVYTKCSFETCAERDPKGLYAKMLRGEVKDFTGKDSVFEEPKSADLIIDTEKTSVEEAVDQVYQAIIPRISLTA